MAGDEARTADQGGGGALPTSGADREVILVGGLHRSGTTLLAWSIAATDAVSDISGTQAPRDEGQFVQDVYTTGSQLGGPTRWAADPRAYLTEADAAAIPDAAQRLWASWSRLTAFLGFVPDDERLGWVDPERTHSYARAWSDAVEFGGPAAAARTLVRAARTTGDARVAVAKQAAEQALFPRYAARIARDYGARMAALGYDLDQLLEARPWPAAPHD